MNANSLQSVVLAALLVAAVGVSATTIESSLSTDPDDVINIDPSWLPIGGDSLVEAKNEMESNAESGTSGEDGAEGASGTRVSESGDQTETAPREADDGVLEELGSKAEEQVASAAEQIDQQFDQGPGPAPSLLDRLLDFLRTVLFALLALGALLLLLLVVHRYADRLLAMVGRDGDRDDGPTWPPEDPPDDVSRAWLAMVRRLEVDRPRSRTPEEWASSAVDAGMDPEAVDALTRTFAEVRYGDAPPTASRKQRAWVNLERVRTAFEGR